MKKISVFLILTIISLVDIGSAYGRAPRDLNRVLKDFEAYAEKTFEDWEVPGSAIAIVVDKRTIFMRGFGVRQLGHSKEVDPYTIFRIASLSKSLSAGLTGALVDKGYFRWDDYVKTFLPKFAMSDPINTQKLTIRHLLSHTTGLFCPNIYDNLIESGVPYHKVLDRIQEVDCSTPPGKKHAYQNVMFSLVGDIILEAIGKPYADAMEQYIFTPLRMYDTTVTEGGYLHAQNKAIPHLKENGVMKPGQQKSFYYQVAPAGGVNSSVANMSNWINEQMGTFPDILSKNTRREMQRRHIATALPKDLSKIKELADNRITDVSYGLGWRIFDYMGKSCLYHGGHVEGFSNAMAFMPTEKIGIVILTNSETPVASILMAKFFDMHLDLPEKDWSQLTLNDRHAPKKPNGNHRM